MARSVTTAPEQEPVTLKEALIHLKADSTPEDSAIEQWIQTAREYVEETCELAIMAQVWTERRNAFPAGGASIDLLGGQVSRVVAVTYLDQSGTERSIPPESLEEDLLAQPATVAPLYGKSWPSGRRVRVAYEVGYKAAEHVPQRFKSAMLLIVGDLHKNRSKSVTGTIVVQNDTVDRLLRGSKRMLP